MFPWDALGEDVRREILRHCDRPTVINLAATSKANHAFVARAVVDVDVSQPGYADVAKGASFIDLRNLMTTTALDGIALDNVRDVEFVATSSEDIAWLASKPMTGCKTLRILFKAPSNVPSQAMYLRDRRFRIEPGAFDAWTSLMHMDFWTLDVKPLWVVDMPAIPSTVSRLSVSGALDMGPGGDATELVELKCANVHAGDHLGRLLGAMQRMPNLRHLSLKMAYSMPFNLALADGHLAAEAPLQHLRHLRLPASCTHYIPTFTTCALDSLVLDVLSYDVVTPEYLPPTRNLALVAATPSGVAVQCDTPEGFAAWVSGMDNFKYVAVGWELLTLAMLRVAPKRGALFMLRRDARPGLTRDERAGGRRMVRTFGFLMTHEEMAANGNHVYSIRV